MEGEETCTVGCCKIPAFLSGGKRWAVPGHLLCQGFPDAVTSDATGNQLSTAILLISEAIKLGFQMLQRPSWQQLAQAHTEFKEKSQWPLNVVYLDRWNRLSAFWVKISSWLNPSFVVSDHSGD